MQNKCSFLTETQKNNVVFIPSANFVNLEVFILNFINYTKCYNIIAHCYSWKSLFCIIFIMKFISWTLVRKLKIFR